MNGIYNSLPYKVEYCVGEQNCKKCEKKIRSGGLKVAIMMQVMTKQNNFSIIIPLLRMVRINVNVQFLKMSLLLLSPKMMIVNIPIGIIQNVSSKSVCHTQKPHLMDSLNCVMLINS